MMKDIPSLTDEDISRFKSKYSESNGCWEWTAWRKKDGYGFFIINSKRFSASRVSYYLWFKEQPGESLVCHKCNNASCVNPDHLFLGTEAERRPPTLLGLKARFFDKVEKKDSCWIWVGHLNRFRYGKVRNGPSMIFAHRASFLIHKGEIPDGLCVCHKCDNPPCVNPEHLFLGTHQDNMDDKKRKKRGVSLSRPGVLNPLAKLTNEQVRFIRSSNLYQKELAKMFAVSQSSISRVKLGLRYPLESSGV